MRTLDDLAVDNDAAADTCSQCDHDEVLLAFSAAFPEFAEGCDIGVIACADLHVKNLAELIFDIFFSPVKVDSHRNDTLHDRSRDADTDADNIFFGNAFDRQFRDYSSRDVRKNILTAVLCACHDFPLVKESAVRLKETALDSGSAYIDTKTILAH